MNNSGTTFRIIGLSFVALALLILLLVNVRNLSIENAETSRLMALYRESEKTEATAYALKTLQSSVSGDIQAFEALVLNNERLVPLIESIEEAGEKLGLETEIVSVDKKEEGEGSPQTITIVVEALGGWNGVYNLLLALESLPHRVMVENASLTKEQSLWRGRVTLSLYSFK